MEDQLLIETQREIERGRPSCLACHRYRLFDGGTTMRCTEPRRERRVKASRYSLGMESAYILRKRGGECEWFDGRE